MEKRSIGGKLKRWDALRYLDSMTESGGAFAPEEEAIRGQHGRTALKRRCQA